MSIKRRGKCGGCGKPVRLSAWSCKECNEIKAKRRSEIREERLLAEICIDCGESPSTEDSGRCVICRAKHKESQKKWNINHKAASALFTCRFCKQEFEAPAKNRRVFCSPLCRQRDYIQSKPVLLVDVTVTCIECAKDFVYQRNQSSIARLRTLCSRKCKIRAQWRRRKYAIDIGKFRQLKEKQEGKCYICKDEYPVLQIDHDHKTGKVRGLLCRRCNIALGMLKDSNESLNRAIAYLKNPPAA